MVFFETPKAKSTEQCVCDGPPVKSLSQENMCYSVILTKVTPGLEKTN